MLDNMSALTISVVSHPLLDLCAFVTTLPKPLGEMLSPPSLLDLLDARAEVPLQSSDEVRAAVRDLLRHGGFKPTGRSKPASEYLLKATAETGKLNSINYAVDVCNVVSLHSGLPISVVDVDLLQPPLHVDIAASEDAYVFNRSGQTIDIGGLLCLFDSIGACANAVKDSQRTKTHDQTRQTLTLIWGTTVLQGRAQQAAIWYHELLVQSGCVVTEI
jgi:DNA/RNA-binding domain of Phe-tRNA-synthetase-like protein